MQDDMIAGLIPNPESSPMFKRLKGLTVTNQSSYSQFIEENELFSSIPEAQKIQINMMLEHEKIPKDTQLWESGKVPQFCFFLLHGKMEYIVPGILDNKTLKKGVMLGDFGAVIASSPTPSSIKTIEDSEILKVSAENLTTFLSRNPGLYLLLKDKFCIY